MKRKACICLLRLYRKDFFSLDSRRPEREFPVWSLLEENDGLQPEDRQEEEGSELPPLMFGGLVSEARGALQRAGHRPADARSSQRAAALLALLALLALRLLSASASAPRSASGFMLGILEMGKFPAPGTGCSRCRTLQKATATAEPPSP